MQCHACGTKGNRTLCAESAVLAAQLKLVGGCRGPDDEARLDQLQKYCQELGLKDCVEFCINVPFDELTSLLAGAVGGLHTMLDEHFGISIVEYMAAGKFSPPHDSCCQAKQNSIKSVLLWAPPEVVRNNALFCESAHFVRAGINIMIGCLIYV